MANPAVRRLCIDKTGMGEMLTERQVDRWSGRVEGVLFTAQVKMSLGMPLVRLFQDALVRVPAIDAVREDLHKVRKDTTAAGNVRLVADDDDDGHADRFWGLALAYQAADALRLPLPPPQERKPAGW
jgi:phage FluMu gp28-like protein